MLWIGLLYGTPEYLDSWPRRSELVDGCTADNITEPCVSISQEPIAYSIRALVTNSRYKMLMLRSAIRFPKFQIECLRGDADARADTSSEIVIYQGITL